MVESAINLEQLLSEPLVQNPHGGCGSCGTGKAAAGATRCGNGLEKIYPSTAVRLGYMRYVGEFSHSPDMKFTCGARVVIQTQRGIEIGEQVSLTCTGCDKAVTRDQMKAWVKSSGDDTFIFNAGRILREATAADLAEYAHIQDGTLAKRDFARTLAQSHKLSLKVVECECLFGGERIIFYFTAAERVDFRNMVKDLATEYRTRIEMRQIGARDEARLLADFETCGREVCCKVFLKTLRPISMRMAKLQKATLDPTQVSGRCGRLKCCLRYEHTSYEELDKLLPGVGARINTSHGAGVVVNRQILTQLVQIRNDSNALITVVAEDILADGETAPPTRDEVSVPPRSAAAPKEAQAEARSTQPRESAKSQPGPWRSDRAKPVEPEARETRASGSQDETREGGEQPTPRRRRRRRRRRRGRGGAGGSAGDAPPAGVG